MFPHRIQILGHRFNLFFLKDKSRETLWDREVSGGVTTDPDPCRNWLEDSSSDFLQGLTCFVHVNATIAENDHGSGSVSESQGGRIPDADFGGRESWEPMRNYDYLCRKAKAAGSRMLISGGQHMLTQRAFEPLIKQYV